MLMNLSAQHLKEKNIVYSNDHDLVISRRRRGKGFSYHDERGSTIRCATSKDRFRQLAVPPVYTDVFFCNNPKGHLQAKGIDSTGNVQYFYHSAWEQLREEKKFDRLLCIGEELPRIRRKINRILTNGEGGKSYVLAAIVKVLDNTGLRIGNAESVKNNHTHGVSTLKKRHVKEKDSRIVLAFTGKSGVDIRHEILNSGVKELIENFYDRPGEHLFDYHQDGERQTISPAQINHFIKQLSSIDMTAKEFRTWRASALFVKFWLSKAKQGQPPVLGDILARVAEHIGNTPSTLRNSYIHPQLIEHAKDADFSINRVNYNKRAGLRKAENYLIALLEGHPITG